MVSKLFLFLFISVLLVTTVYAQETLPEQIQSFQFNQQFDLKRACFDSCFFCSDSFVCNVTLISPSGNLIVDNQLMTNQGSYMNITVLQTQNIELGFITGIESCNNVSNAGPDTFLIAITGDGDPWRPFPQQFVIIIFSLAMVCVGMVNDRLRMFKHLGSILMMIMGVVTLYPGYAFINHSTLMGLAIGSILIGLGFYFLIEDSFSRDEQEDHYDSQSQYVDDD